MKNAQRGITLIGFAILLCVLGFFAYCAMKVFPAFVEQRGVSSAMKQLAGEPGVGERSVEEIRKALGVKLQIQYVDDSSIPPQNIQLKKTGGAAVLRVFYDKRIDFIGNVDLLISYDNTVNLGGNSKF